MKAMKIKTATLLSGGKSEFNIHLQFAEPKYGKVTVNIPNKSKPNQTINISANVVEEDYGNTTYSIGAVVCTSSKGMTIHVNSVSNNNWSFVMPADDVTVTVTEIKYTRPCLAVDTLITLADDSKVSFKDLKKDDIVKVWNFDKGCWDQANLLWLPDVRIANCYQRITFDNGTFIKTIHEHRAFCIETNKFEYLSQSIGKHVYTVNGPSRVVSIEWIDNKIEYRNAISFHHMNIITNDVLTSTGFNNLYPVEDMKFVKCKRKLRTIDEFGDIDPAWFNGLRLYEHYTSSNEAHYRGTLSKENEKWLVK